MRRRAFSAAPWLFSVLLTPVLVAGCSPTATYGTGEAPEMAMFREVAGGFLGGKKDEEIAYQPRAPLVMPPTAEALPPPAETASATSPDWPIDPSERVAVAADSRGDIRAGGSQAEYRRLKPLAGVLPDAPRGPTDFELQHTAHSTAYETSHQREAFQQALADAKGYDVTERRYLTQPPTEYSQPAATAPSEFEDINGKGQGGSWLPWLFGRRN
jgi:hypothetical protein